MIDRAARTTRRDSIWTFAIGSFALCVIFFGAASRATAATEFCPSQLIAWHAGSPNQESTAWYYQLTALGPRAVEGTIVADTDAGWFTWNQEPVYLTRATFTMSAPDFEKQYAIAESPELGVTFPRPLSIRHAWLTMAVVRGGENDEWAARGEVACDIPDFAGITGTTPNVSRRAFGAGDPTPAPAPPMATAVETSAPFAAQTCAQPFRIATPTRAAEPSYPQSLQRDGPASVEVSVVYVAVDSRGHLADAWLFASSGYPAMDAEAIKAARHSQYLAPISYCRPVGGTYLFVAVFDPN